MNVTSMLVLTTLFISVSGSLPTTSYIKMIDIWMIFSLLIPFLEVLLHTYMDTLRQDEEREINYHGRSRVVNIQDETKKDETKDDETKNDETKDDETKKDDTKKDDTKEGENRVGLGSRLSENITLVVPFNQEDDQNQEIIVDKTLKNLFAHLIISDAMKLRLAQRIASFWIPVIVFMFMIIYWSVGLKHAWAF